MKHLKRYIQFIKESSTEWKERNLDIPMEDFFNRFFGGKEKIDEDDRYITYKWYDKQYDEDEDEYFWEKEMYLKVDKSNPDVTHYWEQTIIDRPLYKVREEGMTREQEMTIRTWCGTSRKPKSGTFEGYDKGLAKFKSGHSGKLYHVLPEGDIVEMLNEDKIDEEYINSIIDYLLDTKNFDLIDIVKSQFESK